MPAKITGSATHAPFGAKTTTTRQTAPAAGGTFDQQLDRLLASGWKVKTDGPTGVQLIGPKKMRLLDKLALGFGVLTFWFYGLGIFFIVIALIDYAAFTKPAEQFLRRPTT